MDGRKRGVRRKRNESLRKGKVKTGDRKAIGEENMAEQRVGIPVSFPI